MAGFLASDCGSKPVRLFIQSNTPKKEILLAFSNFKFGLKKRFQSSENGFWLFFWDFDFGLETAESPLFFAFGGIL
jgi:hypothetical protein